jgi:hypothetical protein
MTVKMLQSSCPALGRASTPFYYRPHKTWMAGTSPAMTGGKSEPLIGPVP